MDEACARSGMVGVGVEDTVTEIDSERHSPIAGRYVGPAVDIHPVRVRRQCRRLHQAEQVVGDDVHDATPIVSKARARLASALSEIANAVAGPLSMLVGPGP